MSRSRPTKLEKYRERKVIIAHEVVEYTRKRLEAAELAANVTIWPRHGSFGRKRLTSATAAEATLQGRWTAIAIIGY